MSQANQPSITRRSFFHLAAAATVVAAVPCLALDSLHASSTQPEVVRLIAAIAKDIRNCPVGKVLVLDTRGRCAWYGRDDEDAQAFLSKHYGDDYLFLPRSALPSFEAFLNS